MIALDGWPNFNNNISMVRACCPAYRVSSCSVFPCFRGVAFGGLAVLCIVVGAHVSRAEGTTPRAQVLRCSVRKYCMHLNFRNY